VQISNLFLTFASFFLNFIFPFKEQANFVFSSAISLFADAKIDTKPTLQKYFIKKIALKTQHN